jgi:hypothetical protein
MNERLLSDPAYRSLAIAIIRRAVMDAESGSGEARIWLLISPQCGELLEFVGWDWRRVRRWVLALRR